MTEKGILIPLPGPGPMFIVGRHAYFQLFVIDPRVTMPNLKDNAKLASNFIIIIMVTHDLLTL